MNIIPSEFYKTQIMKQYQFIISDRTFEVENENELSTLLELFAGNSAVCWAIHWNILMEMDKDLEKIVVSYQWLLKCLKYLNEKNSFLLLVKLGDVLGDFINNSFQLAEILSKIPDESNKIRLLKVLRTRWLSKIIFDAKDLANIFEWLYNDSQRHFINLLGREFVREIFFSTNEIIMTLYYLNNENKDYLIEILWLGELKYKIKTANNLLVLFQWLTDKNARKFLLRFSKQEILTLFKTQDQWYHFLLRLSKQKEKIFLYYMQS